jgi:hypothetical protein
MSAKFQSFDEFFLFYLRQHSNRGNRILHAVGTALGLAIAVAALVLQHPWFALLWIPVAYSFAWVGHLLVEGNRPATWGHPWWSLISDFRMLGLMVTGRLQAWMARAEAAAGGASAGATAQD